MNTIAISDMNVLRALLSNLPSRDDTAADAAKEREPRLTKPPGSLGRLEEIALWLATWQGRHPPATDKVAVRVFAGNHGVVARGVSAYPAEVTAQMVGNF
ncbi:MAG: nicotinate-nucleotide--dimethylbenzimidazole phosphoribosyltransferase, partial [Rhodospirillales bacterium]|nr:nicotinate-nucleotide--dimethylbenzimidazole phosphoribosyltransferase [Rhodospirillales bacterium]